MISATDVILRKNAKRVGTASLTRRVPKPWTKTEDDTLTAQVETHGYDWLRISNALPGRTQTAIKTRWTRLQMGFTGPSDTKTRPITYVGKRSGRVWKGYAA